MAMSGVHPIFCATAEKDQRGGVMLHRQDAICPSESTTCDSDDLVTVTYRLKQQPDNAKAYVKDTISLPKFELFQIDVDLDGRFQS